MALRIFPQTSAILSTSGVVLREPFARGLVAAFAPGLGVGTIDLVSGLPLALSGGFLGVGARTSGFVCTSNAACASITCPDYLKLALPITLIARMSFFNSPTTSSTLFGIKHNNTDSNPFMSCAFGCGIGDVIRIEFNSGGSFTTHDSFRSISTFLGLPVTVVGVLTSTYRLISIGPDDGVLTTTATSNPTYGASAVLTIGSAPVPSTRNANICFEYGLIYNRALSSNELALFRNNPYHWVTYSKANQFALGEISATGSESSFVFLQ